MKIILLVAVILTSSIACSCSGGNNVDLSTPEKTLRSYYEGFKRSDFEYQKKTLLSPTDPAAKKRFDVVNPILKNYQILKIREAKDRKEDTFHLPEGDVDVLVKEIDRDSKESINSFVLRKFDSKWLIIDFVTANEAEIPPDIKVIEDKAKEMLEPKGEK